MTARPYKDMYSKTLGLRFTYYTDTGEICMEDGAVYSADEWQLLKGKPAEEIRDAHSVKTVFDGTICQPGA